MLKGELLCIRRMKSQVPRWLRTYQREDEEEAMAEGNEGVSRGNPIK